MGASRFNLREWYGVCRISLLALSLLFLLQACGGGSGGSNEVDNDSALIGGGSGGSNEVDNDSALIVGIVEKGPFQTLQVNAVLLDNSGLAEETLPAEINNAQFSVSVPRDRMVRLEANGQFNDELGGGLITLNQPLTALLLASGDQTQNINIVSHLGAQRALGLARTQGGLTPQIIAQALQETGAALGFVPATGFNQLDTANIASGATLDDPNLRLLLLSAGLLDLPRADGRMPQAWDALVQQLSLSSPETDLSEQFALFNGLAAIELINRIRDAEVVSLPPLSLPDNLVWSCGLVCNFVEFERPGVHLVGTSAFESAGEVTLIVRRDGDVSEDVTLDIELQSDSALVGIDFVGAPEQVTLPAGRDRVLVRLPLIIDALDEGSERFTAEIVSATAGTPINTPSAALSISDDTYPGFRLPSAEAIAIERLCFVAAGAAEALDPMACASNLPEIQGLVGGNPELALRIATVLRSDCADIGNCPQTAREFAVDYDLVSLDGNSEQARTALGTYAYRGRDVLRANEALEDDPQLLLSLADSAVSSIVADAVDQGLTLRVEARLNQPPEQIVASDIPALLRLDGDIQFGDRNLQLIPGTVGISNDGCPAGQINLNASYLVDLPQFDMIDLNTLESGTDLDNFSVTGNACAQFVADAANPDAPPALQVVSADIEATGSIWPVPDGQGTLVPGLPVLGIPNVLILGGLTDQGAPATFVSDGLPFGLVINSGRLTESGLAVNVLGTADLASRAFSSSDPRQFPERLALNSTFFRSGNGGSLDFPVDGLNGRIALNAGEGRLAFPQAAASWQGFAVTVEQGRMVQADDISLDFELEQSVACREAACETGTPVGYAFSGTLAQSASGLALGQVNLAAAREPGFGSRGNNRLAYSRPDDLPANAPATLALPGYRFDPAAPVVASLPGHVENDANGPLLNNTRSQAYRRGNHAPVGVSVGPEIYADAAGQPVQGSGQSLAGRTLRLDTGSDTVALGSVLATKYVIRQGGFTGVFNADPADLTSPVTLSGYPMRFSRFALRAVDNAVDPFNWIDGRFSLPGDAELDDIVFENLEVDCAANLGQGRLVFEQCDAMDNNGNGITDENCPDVLATWRMPTQVNSLAFTGPQGGTGPVCNDEPRRVALGQSVEPKALDKALSMTIGWSPQGHIAFQQTRGVAEYRLEQGQNEAGDAPGFAVAFDNFELGCVDQNPNDNVLSCASVSDAPDQRYGWAEGKTKVALPFWNALDADYRIANVLDLAQPGSPAVAEPSVLLPLDRLAAVNNARVNRQLTLGAEEREADHFDVRYEWGQTGFGFTLPAYFSPASVNENGIPNLTGVRFGRDLIVFEADAGINFVEPIRTKFSFGASANIQALTEFEFQLNLQDGDSLRKVDALLVEAGILNAPVITPILDGVSNRLNAFNRFAGRGLDQAIEAALVRGLEEAGQAAASRSPLREDPLVSVTRGMNKLQTLPDQIIGIVDSELRQPLYSALDDAEAKIRAPFQMFLDDLDSLGTQPDFAQQAANRVGELADAVRGVRDTVNARSDQADVVISDTRQLLDDARNAVQTVRQSSSQVRLGLQQVSTVVGSVCRNPGTVAGEASAYLSELFANVDALRSLLQVVQGTEVLVPIIEVAAQDPNVASSLREGQAGLQNAAEELLAKVSEAERRLKMAVCDSSVQMVVAKAQEIVVTIEQHVTQVENALVPITAQVDQIAQLKTQVEIELIRPVDGVLEVLGLLQAELNFPNGSTPQSVRDFITAAEQELLTELGLSANGVTALIARQVTDTDVLDFVSERIRDQIDEGVGTLSAALRAEIDSRLPGATYSPDDLRRLLATQIMDSGPVRNVRTEADRQLKELQYRVNSLVAQLTDQVNMTVRGALAAVEGRVNAVLEKATAPLKRIPLQSAGIDGFAVIAGEELERVHIGAEWVMAADAEGEDPKSFGAALDAVSWNANNKNAGCSIPEGQSRLDVMLSAFNLPAQFGVSPIIMKKIYMGFTLDQAMGAGLAPKGVFGGLQVQGDIGFSEFVVYDPAFAAGIGDRETYLGASAGVLFSTIAAEAAFLLGRTCNQDILNELDPRVAEFIPIPETGFAGAYVRGAASIPVYSMGCPLTIGVAADFGAWVLAGPPLTLGGLVGGGAFGKVGCVGALRGQLRAFGTVNTDGDLLFAGEGFGVAGLGLCEPAGWTSVERSRQDGLCGTADALIRAKYDGSWSLLNLEVNALF